MTGKRGKGGCKRQRELRESEEWSGGRRKKLIMSFTSVFSARPYVKYPDREKKNLMCRVMLRIVTGGDICSCGMKLHWCWCSGEKRQLAVALGDAERCWCQIYFNEICSRDGLKCYFGD